MSIIIILNSCDEGYKEEFSNYTIVLKEVTAVTSPTSDNTPNYTFSSSESGTISYGGSCSSSTTSAIEGNNTITLNTLFDGTYTDCKIIVSNVMSDSGDNITSSLSISPFTVDTIDESIEEVTAVTTPTNDTTPNYTFSSIEAGTITYGGSCSSSTTSAIVGNNTITFNTLSEGTYSNCTITVTNNSGNSAILSISPFVIDTTAPSVSSFTLDDTVLKIGDTPTLTLVFSETVTAFSSDNISTDNAEGTLGTISTSDNITWTGTFTPASNTEATNKYFVLFLGYTDLAGNPGPVVLTSPIAGISNTFIIDTVAPAVSTFTLSDTALKAGDNATVSLVFSEAVDSFASSADITVANGALATMTSSDNISWSGIFTPTTDTEDPTNTLSLATSYTDTAGNAGPAATTLNYEVETLAPSVSSFSLDDTKLKPGDNATVTLVFSEVVTSFSSNDDITATNGALASTMTSSDNRTWTGIFVPSFPVEDWTNTLTLSPYYADMAGNSGLVGASTNYMVDDNDPSVTSFTLNDTALKSGDTPTVTLVFSEPVASFSSNDDISVTNANGSLASMISTDNITWTGTFTPSTNTEDETNTLSLANSWTDVVGNTGTTATTSNYEVETLAPSANSFTFSVTQGTSYTDTSGSTTPGFKPGDNATVTLVFREPVTFFSSDDDISHPYGDLTTMTSSDNITWTGIFTPTSNSQDYSNRFSLATSYKDVAGNTGTAATSSYYIVDTKDPVVSSFSPVDGRCFPVSDNITVTFDSPMTTSYITTTTADTTCRAETIKMSSDNFSTCVRMSSEPVASNSNQTFTLDPVDTLSHNTTYTINVSSGVIMDVFDNTRSVEDNSSFKSSSKPSYSLDSGIFMGVGYYGKIFRSNDNGSSWDNETCELLTTIQEVSFGNNTFVVVGNSGYILRSTDNGSSFSSVSPYNSNHSLGVAFGNNTFVGVSSSGKIGRSSDNGSSFSSVSNSTSKHLYGVSFGNNVFLVVGQDGKIIRSTDDGSNWNSMTSPISNTLRGVTFGNNKFVAVAHNGKIIRSTDNGSSWDNATSPTSNHLYDVTFGNNTFIGVGQNGKIVRSTDNGSSFSYSTNNTTSHLYGVTFGNNTFVGVGQGGRIVRSIDNGSTWNSTTSPTVHNLLGVTFGE